MFVLVGPRMAAQRTESDIKATALLGIVATLRSVSNDLTHFRLRFFEGHHRVAEC